MDQNVTAIETECYLTNTYIPDNTSITLDIIPLLFPVSKMVCRQHTSRHKRYDINKAVNNKKAI